MADENKPTPQQSQDAVQLDSLTSLQQTSEGDQGGTVGTTDVRTDTAASPANSSPQDGPSFYLPNTDLTNAPPALAEGAPTSDSETETANAPKYVGETIDPVTGALVLGVTVADTPDVQGAPGESGEGERSANGSSTPSGPGAPGPMNSSRTGTVEAQQEVAVEGTGTVTATEPLAPAATTEPAQQTIVSPFNNTVVPDAPVVVLDSVATLTSDTKALTETDAVLSTSGTLTLSDLDATDATVVAQTNTAGTYGQFSIGTNGAWSYTTTDAVNQLNAGQVVTETFTVATSDGGTASVTVNITGTNDAATITGTTQGSVTEIGGINNATPGVPTATGQLTSADVDNPINTFQSSSGSSSYGTYSINSSGAWSYSLNNSDLSVNALNTGGSLSDSFVVTSVDGTPQTITVSIQGSTDYVTITGTAGVDTLTGTAANEVITGGLSGDTLTGGDGLDIFMVSAGVTFSGTNANPVVSGYDKVTDFVSGTDQIQLPVNIIVAANTGRINGTDTNYQYNAGGNTIRSHSISNGQVTFYNANSGGSVATIDSAKAVASAVNYLTRNDLGNAGVTVTFSTTMTQVVGGTTLYTNYIYQQPTTSAGSTNATLVEIRVPTTSFTLDVTPGTKIIKPIALDLNQDGVTYLDRSQGVNYDYANDGSAVSTAWVDSSDGVLAVQTGDGKLNIVFSTQAGETDLQGLAKVYDSNRDDVFDAKDEHFGKFGVWQDANTDAIAQTGEFKTLEQAGITSISLVSSGVQQETANGDVIVYGQSSFTTKDGVTHILEDTGFATTVGTQMIGSVSKSEPALIATVSSTTEGQKSLLGYSVVATLDHTEVKVGDEISLVINNGSITISHILTANDIVNSRYEFKMPDSVIVTDVTNVVGAHLGLADTPIASYSNPVSIPYKVLAPVALPVAYSEVPPTDQSILKTDSTSQTLQFSVLMSEVLVEKSPTVSALETKDFVVSNGNVSSITVENNTHYTLEVVSDGRTPLGEVSLQVAQPELPTLVTPQPLTEIDSPLTLHPVTPDPVGFMLELGGVTYAIDTNPSPVSDKAAADDYALTHTLSAPLVAGAWTEVVVGPESFVPPPEPIVTANPLTDTSGPPMIHTEILDAPKLTDNGSWTP